jgi:hypothetical protein
MTEHRAWKKLVPYYFLRPVCHMPGKSQTIFDHYRSCQMIRDSNFIIFSSIVAWEHLGDLGNIETPNTCQLVWNFPGIYENQD